MTSRRARDTVLDYLPRFASYMLTSTRLSPRTQQVYAYEVKRFAEAVGNPPVGEITPGLLLTWHAGFHKVGAAPATVGQKHAAVKRFLRYLIRFEKIELAGDLLDTFEDLQVPNRAAPAREAYALTHEQMEKIIQAAGRLHPGVGFRNQTMIRLGTAAGLRRSELADFEMDGLNLEGRMATIVGKGNKERVAPFDQKTADQLRLWLKQRESWPIHCTKVFITAGGLPIKPDDISSMVKAAATAAGLRKPVWAHLMRHTAITDLLAGGMALQDVAKIVGHSRTDTTTLYTHQTPTHLRVAYDRARAGRRRGPAVVEPEQEEEGT